MICFPGCKINLGLYVKEKRPDSFHNIETILYPVNLTDALEIIPANDDKFDFQTKGIEIPGNIRSNLCVKAYKLLADEFDLPAVKMFLYKRIPFGAGLGGGSSDAAFTIKLLNELFDLKLSVEQTKEYSNKLGLDCAFFIENKPSFAYEKGNCLKPFNLNLEKYYIIIVKPDIFINTAEAYFNIVPNKNSGHLKEIIKLPVEQWKYYLNNDFEKSIFKEYPEIKKIKEQLYDSGAIYASMSGSGSAVFGIFKSDINIKNYFPDYFVWTGKLKFYSLF